MQLARRSNGEVEKSYREASKSPIVLEKRDLGVGAAVETDLLCDQLAGSQEGDAPLNSGGEEIAARIEKFLLKQNRKRWGRIEEIRTGGLDRARREVLSMAHNFRSLVFTPLVKALQEKYGSRRQYARMEGGGASPDHLGPEESAFIAERDNFYMATVGATGWPYVQHRGGPKGFLKVIDYQTIAFADFGGNKQFISAGNIGTNNRVALIIVDYPRQARLAVLRSLKASGRKTGSNCSASQGTRR